MKSNLKYSGLSLSPVQLTDEYRKKWNVHQNDFVHLTRNGELINSSLYRVGGFGVNLKNDYFILLRQVESYYDDTITKNKNQKAYLANRPCIIDKFGFERKDFGTLEYPYIFEDSLIYSVGGKYYNIETGEFYCHSDNTMDSSQFLFLENKFDSNKSKRGIWKIDKKTGTFEILT